MIWSSDMLRVLNDRKNCFILLDSTTEKKQKADQPQYHFVKAAEFLVWELSIFYGQRYNML